MNDEDICYITASFFGGRPDYSPEPPWNGLPPNLHTPGPHHLHNLLTNRDTVMEWRPLTREWASFGTEVMLRAEEMGDFRWVGVCERRTCIPVSTLV